MTENLNNGVIFKNDHKKEDKHPDYKGKGNFNGNDFEVALWVKTGKDGKKFFSAKFSPPYVKPDQATNEPPLEDAPF